MPSRLSQDSPASRAPQRSGKPNLERLVARNDPVNDNHRKTAADLVELIAGYLEKKNLWSLDLQQKHAANKLQKQIERHNGFPRTLRQHPEQEKISMIKIALQLAKDRNRQQRKRQQSTIAEELSSNSKNGKCPLGGRQEMPC